MTDSLFAVFSINVTFYGFYNWFEQVVSFRKYRNNEDALPFTMAAHYKWHRDFSAKKWIRNFLVFMLFAYYASNVAFMVPFYSFGALPNSDGKFVDMWAVGLMIYVLCVWFTHLIFLMFIRDFNAAMVTICLIVYVQWAIVSSIVSGAISMDPLYKAVWETLGDVHFWSVFFVTLCLMLLPFYIYR